MADGGKIEARGLQECRETGIQAVAAPPRQNLRELLAAKGVAFETLVRLLGPRPNTSRTYRRQMLLAGHATPDEIARMAIVLNMSEAEIVMALEETNRRPGERSPRGRKTKTDEGGQDGRAPRGGGA